MKKSTAFGALYLVVSLAYVVYLCGKAWLIPVTHDEALTALLFSQYKYADILTYNYPGINANNHILNTILAKAWTSLVGLSAFSLRTGNFLSGVFYLLTGYVLLTRFFKQNFLRIVGMILWLGNPYLAEFFALARGYGMTTSLEAGAVCCGAFYLTAEGNRRRKRLYLAGACLLAVLAVWAHLATLNFFLCFLGLIALDLGCKPGKPWLEMGVVLSAASCLYWLIDLPMRKIKAAGDFNYFGNKGFFKDTVETFLDCFTLGRPYFGQNTIPILQDFLILLFLLSLYMTFRSWRKNNHQMDVQTWLLALFPCTVLINVVITKVTSSSFLTTRTTLLLYPLLICATLTLLQILYARWKWAVWLLSMPLVFAYIFNFVKNASWQDTYEWRYDRNTYAILDYIERTYQAEGRNKPYVLHLQCLFYPSFEYHAWLTKSRYNSYVTDLQKVDCFVTPPIDTTVDFYYVPQQYLDHFPGNYKLALETTMEPKSILMRKK